MNSVYCSVIQANRFFLLTADIAKNQLPIYYQHFKFVLRTLQTHTRIDNECCAPIFYIVLNAVILLEFNFPTFDTPNMVSRLQAVVSNCSNLLINFRNNAKLLGNEKEAAFRKVDYIIKFAITTFHIDFTYQIPLPKSNTEPIHGQHSMYEVLFGMNL